MSNAFRGIAVVVAVALAVTIGAILFIVLRGRTLPSAAASASLAFYDRLAELDASGMRDSICGSVEFDIYGRPELVQELMSEARTLDGSGAIEPEVHAQSSRLTYNTSLVRVTGQLLAGDQTLDVDETLLLYHDYFGDSSGFGGFGGRWCVVDSVTRGDWTTYLSLVQGLRLRYVPTEVTTGGGANAIELRAEESTLDMGERYPVTAALLDTSGVTGFRFRITYDGALLSPVGSVANDLLDGLDQHIICETSFEEGSALFDCQSLQPTCNPGVPAVIGGIAFAPKRLGSTRVRVEDVTLTVDPVACATAASTAVGAGGLTLAVQLAEP